MNVEFWEKISVWKNKEEHVNWTTANDSGVWKRGHDKHEYHMVPPLRLDEPWGTHWMCLHAFTIYPCFCVCLHIYICMGLYMCLTELLNSCFIQWLLKTCFAAGRPWHYYNASKTIGRGFDHGSPTYVNQTVNVPKEGAHSFSMMSWASACQILTGARCVKVDMLRRRPQKLDGNHHETQSHWREALNPLATPSEHIRIKAYSSSQWRNWNIVLIIPDKRVFDRLRTKCDQWSNLNLFLYIHPGLWFFIFKRLIN